jgi:hypothetical protein
LSATCVSKVPKGCLWLVFLFKKNQNSIWTIKVWKKIIFNLQIAFLLKLLRYLLMWWDGRPLIASWIHHPILCAYPTAPDFCTETKRNSFPYKLRFCFWSILFSFSEKTTNEFCAGPLTTVELHYTTIELQWIL